MLAAPHSLHIYTNTSAYILCVCLCLCKGRTKCMSVCVDSHFRLFIFENVVVHTKKQAVEIVNSVNDEV